MNFIYSSFLFVFGFLNINALTIINNTNKNINYLNNTTNKTQIIKKGSKFLADDTEFNIIYNNYEHNIIPKDVDTVVLLENKGKLNFSLYKNQAQLAVNDVKLQRSYGTSWLTAATVLSAIVYLTFPLFLMGCGAICLIMIIRQM